MILFLQVEWVPLQKKGEYGVLSACSGGKVLQWTVDSDQGRLVLNAAYALVQQQVPHSSSSSFKVSLQVKGDTDHSVSCWPLTVALKSVLPNQKCIFLTSCSVLLPYFGSFSVSCFDTSCKVFYFYFSIIYQNGTLLVVIRTPTVHVKCNAKEKETPIIIHSHVTHVHGAL